MRFCRALLHFIMSHDYICWNKNANVSQYVIAKIWLKRNYISESYWRRWERWEKRSERGRGRKTKSCGDLWRYAKNSQTKLQAKRCVNAPQAAITFAMRRFAAVWANISLLYERYVRLSSYNNCAKSYALPLLFVNTKRIRVQRHAARTYVYKGA